MIWERVASLAISHADCWHGSTTHMDRASNMSEHDSHDLLHVMDHLQCPPDTQSGITYGSFIFCTKAVEQTMINTTDRLDLQTCMFYFLEAMQLTRWPDSVLRWDYSTVQCIQLKKAAGGYLIKPSQHDRHQHILPQRCMLQVALHHPTYPQNWMVTQNANDRRTNIRLTFASFAGHMHGPNID